MIKEESTSDIEEWKRIVDGLSFRWEIEYSSFSLVKIKTIMRPRLTSEWSLSNSLEGISAEGDIVKMNPPLLLLSMLFGSASLESIREAPQIY